MNPIKFKDKATGKVSYTIDQMAFVVNSAALGDVIATAPVIKHLIDTKYVTPDSYYVVAKTAFRDIFWFVPDSNFRDFDSTDQPLWGVGDKTPIAILNQPKNGLILRLTPKKLHLSHYASLAFAETILPDDKLRYVPLKSVDVSDFGVDFSKSVIIITSFRDKTRSWPAKDVLEFSTMLNKRGLTPVFVGKTDSDLQVATRQLNSHSSLPDDVSEYGIDLRNKTSLTQLASIMDKSFAVCGIDSGPIHLAATTETPVICGFSVVSPEYRVPFGKEKTFFPIDADVECSGCESKWAAAYHNFENCYFGAPTCISTFTADRFIHHIDLLLSQQK